MSPLQEAWAALPPRLKILDPVPFSSEQNDPGYGRDVSALVTSHETKRPQVFAGYRALPSERASHRLKINVACGEVSERRLVKTYASRLAVQLAHELRVGLTIR